MVAWAEEEDGDDCTTTELTLTRLNVGDGRPRGRKDEEGYYLDSGAVA